MRFRLAADPVTSNGPSAPAYRTIVVSKTVGLKCPTCHSPILEGDTAVLMGRIGARHLRCFDPQNPLSTEA